MATFGRTIRIYLADGTPTGIRHAELVNWTGQAIVCPRGRVGELAQWAESQRPGVYLLFGDDQGTSRPVTYIGEAENVFLRLQSHVKNKDFWSRVVLFTSKDENLTKSHVKYLEATLVELVRGAARVDLENGTSPQLPALPRADRDAMEEFLEPLRVLLGSLGFNALQPLSGVPSAGGASSSTGPLSKIRLRFTVPKRGIEAYGASTDEGFVVFEGSRGDAQLRGTLGKGYHAIREELIADGDVTVEGESIRFRPPRARSRAAPSRSRPRTPQARVTHAACRTPATRSRTLAPHDLADAPPPRRRPPPRASRRARRAATMWRPARRAPRA